MFHSVLFPFNFFYMVQVLKVGKIYREKRLSAAEACKGVYVSSDKVFLKWPAHTLKKTRANRYVNNYLSIPDC